MTANAAAGDVEETIAALRRMLALREAERDAALAREAATTEVLNVVNHNPGKPQPVFDAILEKAHRLVGADLGSLVLWDGSNLRAVATLGYPDEIAKRVREPRPPSNPFHHALLRGDRFVHIPDTAGEGVLLADMSDLLRQSTSVRTLLSVPLRKNGVLLGILNAHRTEVRPFAETEIALMENFAAQAVIAMENARLLTEQREALEQQTATAEVLGVINANPGDVVPVFDAILANAHRVCGASIGSLWLYDGELIHAAATRGMTEEAAARMRQPRPPSIAQERMIRERSRYYHSAEHRTDDAENNPEIAASGAQTITAVPLVKDGRVIGIISARRLETRPFSEREIELLENFAAQAVIAMENARLLTETREALEQQTATAEVLGVINANPGDLAPVFDAMLEKAMRLCEAAFGALHTYDGDQTRMAATRGVPEAFAAHQAQGPQRPAPGGAVIRALKSGRPAHILDLKAGHLYKNGHANVRAIVDLGGARTMLCVPLVKDGTSIGYFQIYRQEVQAFTNKQIALLENFAAQAVIAMENARLLTETREALEQQTATAEVLEVINASPGDLTPVFDAMLERALRLCGAYGGGLLIQDGASLKYQAMRGMPTSFTALRLGQPTAVNPDSPPGRMLRTGRTVAVVDTLTDPYFVPRPELRDETTGLGGARSVLNVPLIKEGAVVGAFVIFRKVPGAWPNRQVALLEAFAAQAVIAMENARLLGELRQRTNDLQESLDYQTATSDVLKVISRSTFDLDPVLQTLLTAAAQLCDADSGGIGTTEGDGIRLATHYSRDGSHRFSLAGQMLPITRSTVHGRTTLEGRIIHVEDIGADPDHVNPDPARPPPRGTMLGVPLLRDGAVIGSIRLARNEVRPFTERQIELVSTFADQAVIAIENTRLLTEQREALEQQTATAEVLGVINASPGDLAPVFDAMLEKAMRLCGAAFGMLRRFDGTRVHVIASRGVPDAYVAFSEQNPVTPPPGTSLRRALVSGKPDQLLDIRQQEGYETAKGMRAIVELGGARTVLTVPLVKDGVSVALFTFYRQEVRAFSDKEIALVQTFAAQAVIAMENARLLGELRQRTNDLQESLTYQTATSDVLKVISRSTFDLDPVLDTLLTAAARLCDADRGGIATVEGDGVRVATHYSRDGSYRSSTLGQRLPLTRATILGRTALEGRIIHIEDVGADAEHVSPNANEPNISGTMLGVPLLRGGTVLGSIRLARLEVRPFTDRQIELVSTFADQAVIAIENTRLLTEQREALEQQTATAEVLQVINASPGNLTPVFDAILEKALRICQPAFGSLSFYEDSRLHIMASRGETEALAEFRARNRGGSLAPIAVRLIETKRPVHLLDMREGEGYRSGHPAPVAVADLGGARSLLLVPLLKDQTVIGSIQIYRQEVRAFSDKEIALVENFASQAVIAMENARLINEIRAARDHAETSLRELKIAQANLVQSEKMASLGQLTAGIAHEIKNPLNFVNNFAALSVDLLAEFQETAAPAIALLTDDQRADIDDVSAMLTTNLRKIEEHGKRADGIVKAMLEHSRGSSGERREVDLNALVDEALNLAYHGARAQDQSFNITLERDFATDLMPIELNPQDMTRVFLNMFSNGFYAANKRAKAGAEPGFEPILKVSTRAVNDTVEIRIRDNGTGIPPDIRDKLFQPFFTTKPTGEGTGLGLSITYDIVTKAHGGTITVDSEVGAFTEFVTSLPRHMFRDEVSGP